MLFDYSRSKYIVLADHKNEDLCRIDLIRFSRIKELLPSYITHCYDYRETALQLLDSGVKPCNLNVMLILAVAQTSTLSRLPFLSADAIYFLGTEIETRFCRGGEKDQYFPYLAKLVDVEYRHRRRHIRKRWEPAIRTNSVLFDADSLIAHYK